MGNVAAPQLPAGSGGAQPLLPWARSNPPSQPSPPPAIITLLNVTTVAVCFARAELAFRLAGKRVSFETEIDTK